MSTDYSEINPFKFFLNLSLKSSNNGNLFLNILNNAYSEFLSLFPGVLPMDQEETNLIDIKTPSSFFTNTSTLKKLLKGTLEFEKAFELAVLINPNISKYKNFLTKIAKIESNFRSDVLNSAGAPYYGYFLMGVNEIKSTTGLDVLSFRYDPVALILGAAKLYEMNLKTLKAIKAYDLGRLLGFSDDAMVAGAWLGGPGGVKKYLKGLGDPSDAHWYKNKKGGSSVSKYMKQFNE